MFFSVSGVHQKHLLVTCNYMARAQGVGKIMSVREALEKCPDLVLVSGEDLSFYREISYKVTGNKHTYTHLSENKGWIDREIGMVWMGGWNR